MGIDSQAHHGALNGGGFTVAVLGSGPDVPSPARMKSLYGEIVERGLVLSELPPGTAASKWTFPARNRIMAGLAAMTVVVEARGRSGSLITAGMASDLGREVGAVPGRVGNATSAGANALLRDGAQVIRGCQDVLDSLFGAGASASRSGSPPRAARSSQPSWPRSWSWSSEGRRARTRSRRRRDLAPSVAAGALARLELLGYLSCDSTGRLPADAARGLRADREVSPSLRPVSSEHQTPVALTIAGSDSGGGAGIQADLKAFARCGVHGTSAIVALTAQNTVGVEAIHPVPGEIIVAQVRAVAEDIGVDAVKIGMLGDEATIEAVVEALDLVGGAPVVVDPVMVAESGAVLLDPAATQALVERIVSPRDAC